MTVTTLPFMDAVELSGPRDDWVQIECRLCFFQTHGGALHVCEDQAVEHLEREHPRRYIGAQLLEQDIRLAILVGGIDGPDATRLLDQKRRRGM